MKITKYGHSCLLIEIHGTRIITDPGMWNAVPEVENINAILISHEHQDHCDMKQVQALVAKNPGVRVISHAAMNEKFREAGIKNETIENGTPMDINGVSVESYGTDHACIYGDISPCRNRGYLIAEELFIPGDALHDIPTKPVRLLALPTGGPWMRLSEAIDYAKKVKPEIVFPIHDAMYIDAYQGTIVRIVGGNLESAGIAFVEMPAGTSQEF